jgi:hypothetical protein
VSHLRADLALLLDRPAPTRKALTGPGINQKVSTGEGRRDTLRSRAKQRYLLGKRPPDPWDRN